MTQNVTDSSFQADVLSSDQPVVVDFWAEWCGPCKQLSPILEELSGERTDVKIVKMNIDENPETPTSYGVRGIPTLIMFKGGEIAGVKVGSVPKSELTEWLDTTMKS